MTPPKPVLIAAGAALFGYLFGVLAGVLIAQADAAARLLHEDC